MKELKEKDMKGLKHPILYIGSVLLSIITISIWFHSELSYLHFSDTLLTAIPRGLHYSPISSIFSSVFILPILTMLCSTLLFFKQYETMFNTIGKVAFGLSHSVSLLYLIFRLTIYVADNIQEGIDFSSLGGLFVHVAIIAIILHILACIVVFIFDRSKLISCFNVVKSFLYRLTSLLPLGIVVPVFICITGLFVVIGIGSKINETVNLPTCDSKFAESQVIDIFKSNNLGYRRLSEEGLVENIVFSNPEPIKYDKDIKKYECRADVYMISNAIGFNQYYNYIKQQHEAYGRAGCRVDYSIFKANGKNEVRATYCGGGLSYRDKFSY